LPKRSSLGQETASLKNAPKKRSFFMKKILEIHKNPSQHWVGDGFPVRTILSSPRLGKAINPFLLLDYGGPMEFPPTQEALGVDEHPHRVVNLANESGAARVISGNFQGIKGAA
jgi:hypothetical protein